MVILKKENIENIEKLCDSKKNESNLKLITELSLANRKKFSYLKNLKGKIIISHCKGLDTIIFFFDFRGFYNSHIRLLSENFYCWWCLQRLFTSLKILSFKSNLIVWTVTRSNLSNVNLDIFSIWRETISPQKLRKYFLWMFMLRL